MEKSLSKIVLLKAFRRLDELLHSEVTLIMGGGSAMILAHNCTIATTNVDALPLKMSIEELDPLVKQIALELDLPGDWLNPHFSTFAFVLPEDYSTRLVEVFRGKKLKVNAIGKEDLLIMKCFAHRRKDVGHAKTLIKQGADLKVVEDRIQVLLEKRIKGANEALDFFDELTGDLD